MPKIIGIRNHLYQMTEPVSYVLSPVPDHRFPSTHRLLTRAQYERVFDRKSSVADDTVVLYARENELPHARLGMVVSRKQGNAVIRHRWKRLIREAFRHGQGEADDHGPMTIPAGLDLVVIPRRQCEPSLAKLQRSLPTLARRLMARLVKGG